MKHASYSQRIERVLDAIEDDILRADDREILQEADVARDSAERVRVLIQRQIRLRTSTVPREVGARRRLLAELLRARPVLAETIGAAFYADATPSDGEVDELIEALLQRGVLNPREE